MHKVYKAFILKMFKLGNICINDNAIDYILDLTLSHTYYTQSLCYHLFMNGNKVIAIEDVYKTITKILNQQTETFLEQRNLLTTNQWKFLMAIAKENIVTKPLASSFIQRYHLGSAASVKRMLNSLIEKEMILVNNTIDGVEYRVYNVFLLRWLKGQKYLY